MFFREAAGEAEGPDGVKYELTTNVGTGTPLVRSNKTGKWFILDWCDIVELAIAAGIDKEE